MHCLKMQEKKMFLYLLVVTLLVVAVYVVVDRGYSLQMSFMHLDVVKEPSKAARETQTRNTNRESQDEMVGSRLAERVHRLDSVCRATHNITEFKAVRSGGRGRIGYNRLFYCGIPKVGTTFTYYVLRMKLQSQKPSARYSGPVKSYVIVREPYSRMVSGYLGKIVTNLPWWKKYGTYITRKFRVNASETNARCGNNVSFAEFIKYLIHMQETGKHKNSHWTPMNEQCAFCKNHYDYLVHLETLKDDLRYIYASVNISVDTDFSDEEMTMRDKAQDIVKQRPGTIKCENTCVSLGKVWWSFHARGLIASDLPLPIKGKQCDTITGKQFADMAWKAHLDSAGRIDKYKEKKEALIEMFLSVPLKDRIRVRDLYREDFDLFGYDPEPPELFPELHTAKTA